MVRVLVVDERMDISFPTGFKIRWYIYISYDRERAKKKGEILMARFSEEDILAKGILSQQESSID
jgi:hypothetical protein